MKAIALFFLCVLIVGCSSDKNRVVTYMDEPRVIIKDQNFTQFEDQMDRVESDYLNKKISYAEYLEKKEELDAVYQRQSQKNQAIVDGSY